MKRFLAALALATTATAAYAQCVTNTTWTGSRYVTCTTCCFGNVCNTNCF